MSWLFFCFCKFLPPELDELESLFEDASEGRFFRFLAPPEPPLDLAGLLTVATEGGDVEFSLSLAVPPPPK